MEKVTFPGKKILEFSKFAISVLTCDGNIAWQ